MVLWSQAALAAAGGREQGALILEPAPLWAARGSILRGAVGASTHLGTSPERELQAGEAGPSEERLLRQERGGHGRGGWSVWKG